MPLGKSRDAREGAGREVLNPVHWQSSDRRKERWDKKGNGGGTLFKNVTLGFRGIRGGGTWERREEKKVWNVKAF